MSVLCFLPVVVLAAAPSSAQTAAAKAPRVADVPELSGLAERWSAALEPLETPGFAVAVVKDRAVLALDAFGVRNTAGEPATPDTCYYIASATKPFTAMAVCVLAAKRKVDLDAPVKKYLPRLELPDEKLAETLSLRDLLCHRPGISCPAAVQRDTYTGQITDEVYFALLRGAKIAHEVRYSNVHFTLAGRVIEAASGKKWQDFLTRELLAPAGLTRTTTYAGEMYGQDEHAEPMVLVDGQWTRSPLVKTDRTMHAAGGMGTTARDAARWLLLNLNRGELGGRRLLSEPMAREYYQQQSALKEPKGQIRIEEGFALGWNTGKYRDPSRPYFFHGGGYPGASSYFCFLPEERIGVAVLANSGEGGSDLAALVSMDVLDRLLGIRDQPDLLPAYANSARERRAEHDKTFSRGVNPGKSAGGLSQPPEKYAGTYVHPVEGELEVLFEQGQLTAHNGELPYTLVSTGPDEFSARVVPGMAYSGGFDVDPGGTVVAVWLVSNSTKHTYERVSSQASGDGGKPPPAFDPGIYAGTYQSPDVPGYTFVARAKDGKLLGQMTAPPPSPAQPELELQPVAGEHKFEVASEAVRFLFKVAGGSATGFTLLQHGQAFAFVRVER